MTRLLVSVRNAAEARIALEAGVHLIDVKEPARGSLGAADAERIAEVLQVVDGRVPVSAAQGELFMDGNSSETLGTQYSVLNTGCSPLSTQYSVLGFRDSAAGASRLSYVKWGLAGANQRPDWIEAWGATIAHLAKPTQAVAVQYADWQQARSPSPRELLRASRMHGVCALLVDTYDKSCGGLLQLWPLTELQQVISAARDAGMMIVLAGSLTLEALPPVLALAPDYIAVRGAACQGGREGPIDPRRVRALLAALCGGTSEPASAGPPSN